MAYLYIKTFAKLRYDSYESVSGLDSGVRPGNHGAVVAGRHGRPSWQGITLDF